jgi:hypothetical protein
MPPHPKILKIFLVSLLIFSVFLCVSLILLELAIRIFLPVYDPRGMLSYQYYPQDGVALCVKNFTGRLWKNTGDYNVAVRINRYGFRDPKGLLSSTDNDIFVLGDSMGLGWGVEENKRFSDLLQAASGIPVYNISVPAGDVDTYERLLSYAKKNGAKIRNLILAICMENDLKDYDTQVGSFDRVSPANRKKQPFPWSGIFHSALRKPLSWLERNSAAYHACASLVHQNDFLCRMAIKLGWITANYEGMHKNAYSERVIASSANRIRDLTRPFNALLVVIPSRGLWTGDNRSTEIRVHEQFTRLLREAGASVVDLRPAFGKAAQPLSHYFKNDGHLNEKGHLAAATALAEFFREQKKSFTGLNQ